MVSGHDADVNTYQDGRVGGGLAPVGRIDASQGQYGSDARCHDGWQSVQTRRVKTGRIGSG